MAPRNIIIDTDPGQDDAVAIPCTGQPRGGACSGHHRRCGKCPIGFDTKKCPHHLRVGAKTDVPVFAGAKRPLERTLVTAEHVHGKTGLDGPTLPDPKMPRRTSMRLISSLKPCARNPRGPSHSARWDP